MPLQDSIRPLRASALRVELPAPHSRELVMQPPSLRQCAACLALDPKADAPSESQRERLHRLSKQTAILFGPEHADLVDRLTVEQCMEIVQALYLVGAGIDPTDFVEVQKHRRKQRELNRTSAEVLHQIDAMSLALAADLRQMPSTVAEMPLLDAVNLSERLAENAKAAARFEGLLHGITLS